MSQRSNTRPISGLADLDVFLLHMLVYRNKQLRAVDLAFALSIDDMHVVSYSLMEPAMALIAHNHDLRSLTTLLRALSGVYEQAARSAASARGL